MMRYVAGPAAMLLMMVLLAACGSEGEAVAVATVPAATPTVETTAPTPVPTVAQVVPTETPSSEVVEDAGDAGGEGDSFALGERIFKTEAGDGIGCSYCHGEEGKGNIGPNIRGKSPGDIEFALESVEAMEFINLNETKINAVSEYLQWLATQP
ncbi:MAG: hypothetical protein O3A47_05370 [Chloroflexi bacterium]|nr:hypothetical protein [Chloroflexota bacterium]